MRIERDKARRSAPEPVRRTTTRLDIEELFALGKLIEEEYPKKRLHDDQFAEYASENLGFAVTEANIKRARTAKDIPSTREVRRGERLALEAQRTRRYSQDATLGVNIDTVHERRPASERAAEPEVERDEVELLAIVRDLQQQWEAFRKDAREKAASTSHRIDQFELRVSTAERGIESARRDASLAREETAAMKRDVEGIKTSARENFEKIGARLHFLTKAQGSLLTKEHPNGVNGATGK